MRRAHIRTWVSGLALLATVASATTAAEPGAVGNDPKAQSLLDEVARAYRGLAAYSDQGESVLAMTIDGRQEKHAVPLRLTLVRPDRLNLQVGPVRLVTDGKTLTTAVGPLKQYVSQPAPKTITLETFREGSAGAMLFGGPTAPAMLVLTKLLVEENAAKAILAELDGRLKMGSECEVDGARCVVLVIDREEGPDYRLIVDPATKLLRRIELVVEASELNESTPSGRKIALERFDWSSGPISTTPAKLEVFAFEPPKGFTKVEEFAHAAVAGPEGEAKFRVLELLGKPAPDFTLSVIDTGGKFAKVRKADLAGKVVLIDFWATWCGPCMVELPEVQKLIEAYATAKKDVVVIALSQDKRPSELGEVRKLVEVTLAKKNIVLTGNPVGKVALDPSGTIGDAFQVEYFPTVVILDTKGVVQAAHVGAEPDIRDVLTKDIDTLLSGQPLLKPKTGVGATREQGKP